MFKMMLVGDVHLRAKRLSDVANAWSWAVKWARNNEVDLLLQVGDVFDHYNVCGREASTGTVYAAFLDPLASNEPRMLIVLGNHDMARPGEKDALSSLEHLGFMDVVRSPRMVNVPEGPSICALPWLNRAHLVARLVREKSISADEASERVQEALGTIMGRLSDLASKAKDDGRVVIFAGHVEVTGASLAGGHGQSNGSFEVSPNDLAGIGADAYALAHIHVRQALPGLPRSNDGYLGALCQLSFGEQDNPAGFRVIGIEDGVIASDQWVENDASPRYMTVSSMDGLNYRHGTDYVKVRSSQRPDDVPEGVMFEKIPERPTIRHDGVSSDASLPDLLSAWHDDTGCEVPLAEVEEIIAEINEDDLPCDPIGSLERIDHIELRNITCHEHVVLDLSEATGAIGLEGPNGSGKTTIVEVILAALFGTTPSRPRMSDMVRTGCGDAMIEVAFRSVGRNYVARREMHKTKKTFSHKAMLFEVGCDEAVAGPKVEDVNSRCARLVGDPQMVLAGVFSAQGEIGNIVDMSPADRKRAFAKLLGTDRLLAMSSKVREMARSEVALVEAREDRIARIDADLAGEEDEKRVLAKLMETRREMERKVSDNEAGLAKAMLAFSRLREVVEARREIIKEKRRVEALVDEIDVEIRAATERLSNIKSLDIKKASEAVAGLREREALLADGNEMLSKSKGIKLARLQEMSTRQLKIKDKIEKFKEIRARERLALSGKADETRLVLERAKAAHEAATKSAGLLEGFPDVAECKSCPLARDGMDSRARMGNLAAAEMRAREALSRADAEVVAFDDETKTRLAKARGLLPRNEDWQPEKMIEAVEIEKRAASVMARAKTLADKYGESLTGAEDALDAARGAEATAAKIRAEMALLESRKANTLALLSGIIVPEEPDESGIKAMLSEAESTKASLSSSLSRVMQDIGRAEGKLESYATMRAERDGLTAQITSGRRLIAAREAARDALGRDGIPQMMVDTAMPHFQDIMNDMLSDFEQRMAVQVRSQRATRKGDLRETIDIVADDGYGERDISSFSGGEKKVLRSVVRIAFSRLQAERSGKGVKVLVLDEATDAMDSENAACFMGSIDKMTGSFNQVFVVSHDDDVLASLQSRIICSKNGKPIYRSQYNANALHFRAVPVTAGTSVSL